MTADRRTSFDEVFPRTWPSRYRRRRKLSPLRKKRGGLWNLRPFVTLSQRKRADAVIKLRNKIRLHKADFGGRYLGGLDLITPERPWQYMQNAQVYFCGSNKRVYWNTYIHTAREAFWGEVSDIAAKRASAMLSAEERKQEFVFNFSPDEYDAWGYPTSFTLKEKTNTYPQFDGLTYRDYKSTLEAEIIANESPEIYERISVDQGFEDGIGLHIVVDAPYISKEVVERVIDRFFEVGETDWQSDTPIPRDRLPYETEMEFFMTVPHEKR